MESKESDTVSLKRFTGEFDRFAANGTPVSGTLKYLLENNIWAFWRNADSWRKANLPRMLRYIQESGVPCYGSPEAYQAHKELMLYGEERA